MNHISTPNLPLRQPLMLSLGLAAIILGILGMHTLNVTHLGGAPGPAVQTVQAAPGQAAYQLPGPKHATSFEAGAGIHADSIACAGPCGSGHDVITAICVLMIAGLISLFFIPRQLRVKARHSLRAPPVSIAALSSAPRTPSLVQLSISRT